MAVYGIKQLEGYYNQGYTYLPIIIKEKVADIDPIKLFTKLKEQQEYSFILESGKAGRYTYFGSNPLLVLKAKNGIVEMIDKEGNRDEVFGNPLQILKKVMRGYKIPKIPGMPKFYGGAIGYFSYDMAKYFEGLPDIAIDDLNQPDLYFMIIDELWVYDNQFQELYFIKFFNFKESGSLPNTYNIKLNSMKTSLVNLLLEIHSLELNGPEISLDKISRTNIKTSFTEKEFIQAVNRIKEYIAQGDVFQVNLSIRQSKELLADSFEVYRHLREINPSPYMGYLHFPDMQLVSGSPELLIGVNNNLIQTRPIAGTRPRGKNKKEDERLIKELLTTEKEIAEHIMLVDLERNDLGRVCKYGTVKANELMVIEKYSHVMHIVSNITGEIDDKFDIYDCIEAAFPGGTITGAPKIRTMEIIEELEPVKRGIYTGSMGWIGFNEDLELNILIRTLLVKGKTAYIQAGAGIVIDSVPEDEYRESLNKAEALWKAVESSEKERRGLV